MVRRGSNHTSTPNHAFLFSDLPIYLSMYVISSTPGKDVYGEKRIQVEGPPGPDGNPMKLEYR